MPLPLVLPIPYVSEVFMLKSLATTLFLIFLPAALTAQSANELRALRDALGISEILEVMREEGLENGQSLRDDMFPGKGGQEWNATLSDIFDVVQMSDSFDARFAVEMSETNLSPLIEFFTSERGKRIIALEISGRRALLDDAVEEASHDYLRTAEEENDPRLAQIKRFSQINALVDTNVEGSLNSNYSFYQGLQDGGAFERRMSEQQMLADVWGQEPQIRSETEQWVYSFLLLAYQPLSDEDIEAYIELSETSEGRILNNALFAAFDTMYAEISHALGLASARYLSGEDI
ncbi:DUF2059 domain-containing protein [Pseudohalocynthiibacter aestuariivivens]|uniref:DUF2059 domain-containing protein n=1 Tax=Pseudohalocynthiibacter aestuariivivens TaxID=1591409 RepID=A0ABV5JG25_9RHOB|nr:MULTISPECIES: DUF2059 domain-containing protein [Pseudohalocynthiibacter]MBS9716245.1 DUF2059 domain-containing protein [Pseudohalocynthiibacter aestuariivivens]MCK0100948.1 DUF2059 domain-containing protein [Pseudohalocynthiibacter sp. F2068]